MAENHIDLGGLVVAPDVLAIERARATAAWLSRGGLDYARLVECRRRAEGKEEVVVIDVDVQRPQMRTHDVRAVERVAIVYFDDDRRPDVISLRSDFPQVPHLNLSFSEYPKSLCLYEQDWRELRSRWTPTRFIERIRYWFAETAKGALHKEDQPLEPLIVGSGYQIVVPHDLFTRVDAGEVEALNVRFAADDANGKLLLATRSSGKERSGIPFVAVAVRTEPQTHGVIRKAPTTLAELHQFLSAAGCDLLGKLRASTTLWATKASLKCCLVVVAACPKRRGEAATVEATDVWAFLTFKMVEEVLAAIGRRARGGGVILGEAGDEEQGQAIPVEVVRTTFSYSRDLAAHLNGQRFPVDLKIVAVGLGAIGSKIQLSLARSGFGRWTLVDDDVLLPHNLSRHQYGGVGVGWKKAEIASSETGWLFGDDAPPEWIATNVLDPGEASERLAKALGEAALILDTSASVTVARSLAARKSAARRVSVFFNPSGTQLVMLVEDQARTVMLDALEFQFYRGLLVNTELESHLVDGTGRVRYAASCRDITSQVPDDQVSLLAAIGARAVRTVVAQPAAQIKVWKLEPDSFHVSSVAVPVASIREQPMMSWTLVWDDALTEKLKSLRAQKLPKETGGVLLGFFDHESRRAYVVDTIASPPDSEEWPTFFTRGSATLTEELARVNTVTAGNLEYVGEWHSHPVGCSCRPSNDDLKVFAWLTTHMSNEGQPSLMAIVGNDGPHFFLGEMLWRGE